MVDTNFETGLSQEEASLRLEKNGKNQIPEGKTRP